MHRIVNKWFGLAHGVKIRNPCLRLGSRWRDLLRVRIVSLVLLHCICVTIDTTRKSFLSDCQRNSYMYEYSDPRSMFESIDEKNILRCDQDNWNIVLALTPDIATLISWRVRLENKISWTYFYLPGASSCHSDAIALSTCGADEDAYTPTASDLELNPAVDLYIKRNCRIVTYFYQFLWDSIICWNLSLNRSCNREKWFEGMASYWFLEVTITGRRFQI